MLSAIAALPLMLALANSPAPSPKIFHPTALTAKAPAKYNVAFKTTAGSFVVEVDRSWAPQGADRFYNLVRYGFYNGATFFRVVPHFVIQFGLSPNPKINAAWTDADLHDDPVKGSNKTGYLSFASAGPNTRTTQVFVNLADNARLDAMGFAPFGKVISGMNAVSKIFAGYGEQPDQNEITSEGKAYTDKSYPKLDKIESATISIPAPAPKKTPGH
ncbi:MAG: peptidylprolyl isomerase [Candidatus Tumulicola sp.]